MSMRLVRLMTVTPLLWPMVASAQLPPPPTQWADWDTTWHSDDPGELAADSLLDRPAGRRGGVVVRDGHFYSGDLRVRLWGVNLAFGANFPPHDVADQLARRFARYGINAVRFHHMDNQPFPNGIFADRNLEQLSPEALDRLDYFVAALKARGVYADLNLHVSRNYSHYHRTADGGDGPKVDKMVDLFDPELIAAQRRYASDLLKHVNAHTHARYADEPGVALVEVNNENSLFMWGAAQKLAELPEPYAAELKRQWNAWLVKRYGNTAALSTAWAKGSGPAGPNLVAAGPWRFEQHGSAAGSLDTTGGGLHVTVDRADGPGWHVQVSRGGLAIRKGRTYHVRFTATADRPTVVTASVGQAHDPWQVFGAGRPVTVDGRRRSFTFGFTAATDEPNARLSFAVGTVVATIDLSDVDLHEGGDLGLAADEDPARGTVRAAVDDAGQPRHDDWLTFLEQTEEAYYTGMRDYLHRDLGVRCPVIGTIGFGPLGTYAQRDMDAVDAHAYWQHPTFPHKQWDMSDWTIPNTPMVDQPGKATLWQLAATRVAGKPFTVTEYQEPAPNDWQAECVPEIATFAALQDWDAVFLFAYSHDGHYDKGRIASFFDIEGNPTKMPFMPIGARLFLGGAVEPVRPFTYTVTPDVALASAGGTDMAAFLRSHVGAPNLDSLEQQTSIRFSSTPGPVDRPLPRSAPLLQDVEWWTPRGSGRRVFQVDRPAAHVQVGFGSAGATSPFAAIMVVPADPSKPIASADRLLVTAVGRAQNTDMVWNATRTSVGNLWGHAPVQIEVVKADVRLPGRWSHAWALDPAGKRTTIDMAEPGVTDTVLHLGRSAAVAYVVER